MMFANEINRHSHVFIRFPGGKYKAATFSFDDGCVEDMWTVELLKSHGMKATFNLNTGWIPDREDFDFESLPENIHVYKNWCHRMTEEQIRRTFPRSGMELATHGYTHAVLSWLEDDDALIYEIQRDRLFLEDVMGESVRGHAYAQSVYDKRVTEVLPKAGIVYARNGAFHEDFSLPTSFMEWGPTCHYLNESAVDRFLDLKESRCIWFNEVNAKLLYIFAHTCEFNSDNGFNVMERSVEKLASAKDEIWFCTNMEYYRYTMAYRSLDFSLARDRVYNPSAIPVWIFVNDKVVEIGAGETISI